MQIFQDSVLQARRRGVTRGYRPYVIAELLKFCVYCSASGAGFKMFLDLNPSIRVQLIIQIGVNQLPGG